MRWEGEWGMCVNENRGVVSMRGSGEGKWRWATGLGKIWKHEKAEEVQGIKGGRERGRYAMTKVEGDSRSPR
jgi:hypothetical protein